MLKRKLLNYKIKCLTRSEGYTIFELIVSTSIIATLTAMAAPSFIEAGNKAKGAKAMDHINNIGTAVLAEYNRIAGEGDQTATNGASAIATFNEDLVVGGNSTPINDTDPVIIYGDGTTSLSWLNLFPDGTPVSPFNGQPFEIVSVTEGYADWSSIAGTVTLTVTEKPAITIQDPAQPSIIATFTP
ncbi:MAG: type II secretion system protein [Fidelibacterota bacterium]